MHLPAKRRYGVFTPSWISIAMNRVLNHPANETQLLAIGRDSFAHIAVRHEAKPPAFMIASN